jgi:transcriptional regulator with GAF, ATPase, and Fis domain
MNEQGWGTTRSGWVCPREAVLVKAPTGKQRPAGAAARKEVEMPESDDVGNRRAGQGQPSSSYSGDTAPDDLARTLSDLARSLQNQDSIENTFGGIVTAAVQTVPGAEYAGLTVVEARRKVGTPAATDDVVREVDRAQYDTGQGPCLSAVYEQQTVRLSDMASEQRWPEFTRRALDLGIRSMLSFQLYVVEDNLGALNLYSADADAFDDESEHVGLLFAAHAAVAMAGARNERNLARAISMRDLIGQAKGILMERHRLTEDQAFALLVRASQHTNVRLVEIARRLAQTGELSPSHQGRRLRRQAEQIQQTGDVQDPGDLP